MAKLISVKLPIREALRSRMFVTLWIVMLVQVIILVLIIALMAKSSTLQEPVHMSQFSPTFFYRDQWTYLWNFAGFGGLMLLANGLISVKILELKGRSMALAFLSISIAVLAIATTLTVAIMRVAGIGV
jgi:hypothetical protein